jgi:hypothetical protein
MPVQAQLGVALRPHYYMIGSCRPILHTLRSSLSRTTDLHRSKTNMRTEPNPTKPNDTAPPPRRRSTKPQPVAAAEPVPALPKSAYPDRRRPGEVLSNLTPLMWLRRVGTVHAKAVCERAGVSYENFKHVAHGRRRLSLDPATRMVRASGGAISFEALAGIRRTKDGLILNRARPAPRAAAAGPTGDCTDEVQPSEAVA